MTVSIYSKQVNERNRCYPTLDKVKITDGLTDVGDEFFFSLVIARSHFLGDNRLSGSDVVSRDNNLASLVVVTEVCSKSSFALRMHW